MKTKSCKFISMRAPLVAMLVFSGCLGISGQAVAQEETVATPPPDSVVFWDVEIGAGGQLAPRYQGSDSYRLTPYPIVKIKRFKIGGLDVGGDKVYGLSIYPSFMFRDKRSHSDDNDLRGLPEVDRAFELGLGLAYEQEHYKIFAQGRNGVIGHHGWTGEIGFDLKSRPSPEWSFKLGPRLSFADARYTDEYFGIKRVTRHFDKEYNPGGGIKSYGVAASAKYRFNEKWAWETSVEYERLTHNAADSDLVKQKNQFIVRSGLSYRFNFGF